MGNSTTNTQSGKGKAHLDFPLFWHVLGGGRRCSAARFTISAKTQPQRQLVTTFLCQKRIQRDLGQLTSRSCGDYKRTCEAMLESFGKHRAVLDFRRPTSANSRQVWPTALGQFHSTTKLPASGCFQHRVPELPYRPVDTIRRRSQAAYLTQRCSGCRASWDRQLRSIALSASQIRRRLASSRLPCSRRPPLRCNARVHVSKLPARSIGRSGKPEARLQALWQILPPPVSASVA